MSRRHALQRSKDRILTTHVGSLPRPQDLEDLLYKVEFGEPYDAVAFDAIVSRAVSDIVTAQREWGIDVINSGFS